MTETNVIKVLIIDDEKYRHDWFSEHLRKIVGIEVYNVMNGASALTLMRLNKFDLIFFDHDLGDDLDGSRIATTVLMESEYNRPSAVWVHSQNWHGAQNIESKFRSVGIRTQIRDISSCMGDPESFVSTVLWVLKGFQD